MNKYGYKEVRVMDSNDLRNLCIKQNWCTNASNEEYHDLLIMCDKDNITTDDVVEIATVIHSLSCLDDDYNLSEHFSNICFLLFKICITFIHEV